MKNSLFAVGVLAVLLAAGTAQAQNGNPNNGNNGNGGSNGNAQGGNPNNGNNGNGGSNGNAQGGNPNNGNNGNGGSNGNAGGNGANTPDPNIPTFGYVMVPTGPDIGTASNSDGATFTLTGAVSTDCAYYSGNNNTETLDFGQIGIYASDDTGPAAAFTMVAPANVSIDTNLAGCNTANTVRIAKTDVRGMVNNGGSGYDTDVFQANLPYSVTASYKASGTGAPAAGTQQTLLVAANADQASRTHGAWKSAMSLDVNVPQAQKALLAGTYSGTFSVTISAGI